MSEEIIEDMLEEVAPQVAGDYPGLHSATRLVKS